MKNEEQQPPRVNILGVGVHAVNMDQAVARVEEAVRRGQKGYVCVTGVHGIMEAQGDRALGGILNRSLLTTPDGMPTVWVGRRRGHRVMDRVYGPDLMMALCARSVAEKRSHFLYGGAPGVAEALKARLETRFPGIRVAGTYTPPFRALNTQEQDELRKQVNEVRPDYFWVGLSTPKQERFMAEYLPKMDAGVMLGVGAAFDIHTGRTRDAPAWIKRSGLQWLHRLFQEPGRLWRRYLRNNPVFLARIFAQELGIHKYELY